MTSQIPPEGDELEFARNSRTGGVHVIATPYDEDDVPGTDAGPGEFVQALLYRTPMMCGTRLFLGWDAGDEAFRVSTFSDDDLCKSCVRALGDQAPRAFIHPRRGDTGG